MYTKNRLLNVIVYGEPLTVDQSGTVRNMRGTVILEIEPEQVTDAESVAGFLETVLHYDYQDNKEQ